MFGVGIVDIAKEIKTESITVLKRRKENVFLFFVNQEKPIKNFCMFFDVYIMIIFDDLSF